MAIASPGAGCWKGIAVVSNYWEEKKPENCERVKIANDCAMVPSIPVASWTDDLDWRRKFWMYKLGRRE